MNKYQVTWSVVVEAEDEDAAQDFAFNKLGGTGVYPTVLHLDNIDEVKKNINN